MKILRADHLGMCFGVRDAIALALKESESAPLTILGDLVHNETVLATLQARGVAIEQDARRVNTSNVMVTAHGASGRALARTRALGLNVLEATCPLVRVAHEAVARLVSEGFHPVIIGQRDHVEVRGLTGDLDAFDVVLSEEDVRQLQERPRFGFAAQTTQPIFPKGLFRFIYTVCQPTKQRQTAAAELARRCDVVIVIGGANSNNTRELVTTCGRYCGRVHHVQSVPDLDEKWFAGAQTVGITAGTSTPDSIIREVESALMQFADGAGRAETKRQAA
jgi:4-hydroxy-3-methylbut-2-enyl diphosphate reductase